METDWNQKDTLYHYTGATALIGIIKNESVWASDARFLNDWREFEEGLSILVNLLQSAKTHSKGDPIKKQLLNNLEIVWAAFKEQKRSAYVFSLSTEFDDLSQWRGYTQ
ncbi:MAG: hypothetical protein ACTSWQ_08040, partial [Candidatus Thorarchaeota archaeon]